jgi:fibronectin-binding autotransporter adhesin
MKKLLILLVLSIFMVPVIAHTQTLSGAGGGTTIYGADNGYCAIYNSATARWESAACPGAGTGAATTLGYVTWQTEASLDAERVLTESTGIDLSTAIANQLRVSVNTTEIGTTTWGSGGASYLWTYNVSGTTDPVITVSDGVFNVSAGTLQQAGTKVALGIATSTDHRLTRWDSTGGQQLQTSAITVDDSGNVTGVGTLASGVITATGAVVPGAADTYALGSSSAEWSDLYLGDSAIIYGQNDSSNTITSSSTDWSFAKDVTIAGGDLILISATAGAGITGGDGTLSLKGLGSGTDEIMTIDLNTNNVITLASTTSATFTITPDLTVIGLLKTGSGPTTLTDAAGKILSAALNTVGIGQGGTGATAAATTNGIVYGASATAYGLTAAATVQGQILTAGASPFVPAWTTATYPATATTGGILYASGTNIIAQRDAVATGSVLVSAGLVTAPVYSAAPVLGTSLEAPFIILGSAATAADAGALRLPNATNIAWELAATGTDVTFGVNSSDDMVAALVAATDIFHITTGNFKVGAGTQTQTLDGADAYITGFLEVDALIYADGGITGVIGATGATTGAFTSITATTTIEAEGVITAGTSHTALTDAAGKILSAALNTVAIAQGGTGQVAAATTSGIVYGASSTALGMTSAGAEGNLLRAGVSPFTPAWSTYTTPLTATTGTVFGANATNVFSAVSSTAAGPTVLTNTAGTITWESAAAPGAHAIVGASHTLTGATTGTLLAATATTTLGWTTAVYPLTATTGGIFYGFATNDVRQLAGGATTTILVGGGANLAPVWTTASGTGAPARVGSPTFTGDIILPSTNADPAATAGALRHDSTVSNFTNGALVFYDGTNIKQIVSMTTATASACTGGQLVGYDSTDDLWKCVTAAGTGDFLADGTVPMTGSIKLIATGVDLSASNGTLTILGLGNGYDENLTIDFNTTENVVAFNSGTAATFVLTPATKVTGILSAGSGPTTLTDSAGKILSAALNTVAIGQGGTGGTAVPTTNGVVYGASSTAYAITAAGTTAQPLFATTTGAPSFRAIGVGDLPIATVTTNGVLYGTNATTIGVTAVGAEGNILRAGASPFVPAWTTSTFANTYVQGGLLHAATANTIAALAPGAVGSFLMSNGASAALSYLAAGTSAQLLIGAGATTIPIWTAVTGDVTITNLGVTAIGADKIKSSMVDWGAGADQIDLDDIADSASFQKVIADDVDASGHIIRLYDSDSSTYVTVTGLATTARVLTIQDVAGQTLANLGTAQTFSASNTFTPVQYFGGAAAAGSFRIYDGTDNYVTLNYPASSANTTFSFPLVAGTNGYVLITDGAGQTSWTGTIAGDVLAVGDCAAGSCFDGSASQGSYLRFDDTATTYYTQLQGATTLGASATITMPNATSTLMGSSATGGPAVAGLIFGDASPDAAGEIAYATGVVQVYDGTAARTVAFLETAQTFTGNMTFGNADTDTLTIQSLLIGGNSRALWIAATAPTPTYATTADDLYVAGSVEVAGTIYAAAFNGGTGTEGTRGITLSSNNALTPTADQIYFVLDGLHFSEAGAEKHPMKLEDAQTATGKKTFSAGLASSNGTSGGFIDLLEPSAGGSSKITIVAPSLAADVTLTLPTTDGDASTYLMTDGSGVLSWGTPTASASTTGGTGGVQFNAAGVLTSDAGFVFTTATDKLTLGSSGGATTGTLDLYYTGTTYAATITPNASMAADVTITLPAATGTLIGTGANTFTGAQTLKAGEVGVGGAPLYFTSGTDLTTAAAGAMEFDGTYLHFSPSTTRYNIPLIAAMTTNGIPYGNNTALMPMTAAGTEGQIFRAGASGVPTWSTATYPATATTNGIMFAASATGFSQITAGTEGQILRYGASGVPAATTATYPATATTNGIMIATSATGFSQLATGNSGVLVTNVSGVPSISTTIPAVTLTTPDIGVATGTSLHVSGAIIAASVTIDKVNGAASTSLLYEATTTETNGVGWKGPASRASDLYLQFSDADPAINQFMLFPAPTTGTSTAVWTTYGQFAALPIVTTSTITAGSGPTTLTDATGKVLAAALNTVGIAQGGTGATAAATTNGVVYGSSGTAYGLTAAATVQGQLLIAGASPFVPGWSTATITQAANALTIANGTANVTLGAASVIDVAAGVTVNADTNLTVQTGAVTLTGNAAGSTLVLPTGSVTLPAAPIGGTYSATANTIGKRGADATTVAASGIVEDGTDINAAALNLVSTGAISGGVKILTITTGLTIGTSPLTVGTDRIVYGGAIVSTTTATIVLPALTAGMSVCVYSLSTNAIVIDVDASDVITLNGLATTAGDSITSASGAGDFICLLGVSTSSWLSLGRSGVWTDTN